MEIFNKLRGETEKTLNEMKKWTKDSGAELAAAFATLKKTNKNTTDGIVKWMEEVKLILNKETEEQVRTELNTAPDKKDIKFTQFRDTVMKRIDERRKELQGVGKQVVEEGGRMAAALRAGTSALQGVFGNKSSSADIGARSLEHGGGLLSNSKGKLDPKAD